MELEDRFGDLPDPAQDLLTSIKIKWIASRLGLEKIILKQNQFVGYFIADQNSKFYHSDAYQSLIRSITMGSGKVRIKEKQTRAGLRLLLKMDQIDSVDKAFDILNEILPVDKITA